MNEPYMLEGLSSWKKYMTEKDNKKKFILKRLALEKKV